MNKALVAAVAAMLLAPAVALGGARPSFTPSDPLAPRQYYLTQDRAFDAFDSSTLPALAGVRVAVIDSGIDGSHPEFKGRVAATRSFVGGSGTTDDEGHGTFVAGEIAAAINDQGIAGIAFPAQLLVAKIARADASISVRDEAAAIRWAVKHGARVINLSLGGLRHPFHGDDSYSQVEANAIDYAYRRGAVLVAAVGNADDAPRTPWPWASYPAALSHVIGVSALTPSGNVPPFSNRDRLYNDISAPGQNIFSTLPLALTKERPSCADQGYSDCGPDEFVHASGTSFAAPQVTAAAALLLALKPALRPEQVANILERTANDVNASDGCDECPTGRDQYSGWGRLDIAKAIAALNGPLPPADRLEPNDDAGSHAAQLRASVGRVKATLDFWDDPIDVYRVRLVAGKRLSATLRGPSGATTSLLLWRPGTVRVTDRRGQRLRAAQSIGPGSTHRLSFRVPATGWYYVEAKITSRGAGAYTLTLTR